MRLISGSANLDLVAELRQAAPGVPRSILFTRGWQLEPMLAACRDLDVTYAHPCFRPIDADLVVVDPRNSEAIRAKRLRYKCGWTPFEGMEACFPHAVYLRGEPVVEDGEPSAEGHGRLLQTTG